MPAWGLSRCLARQASDRAQRLVHCASVRKDFCDIRVEENNVSAFRISCRSDAADRFRKIVLGPHSVFVRTKQPGFSLIFLHNKLAARALAISGCLSPATLCAIKN